MRATEFISPEQEAYEAGAYRKAAGLAPANPWNSETQYKMYQAYLRGYDEAELDPGLARGEELGEATIAFRRQGEKIKQKFRCTSGPRAGRVVADLRQCGAHPNPGKAAAMKVTRARTKVKAARKSKRTKRVNPISKIVQRMNKVRKK